MSDMAGESGFGPGSTMPASSPSSGKSAADEYNRLRNDLIAQEEWNGKSGEELDKEIAKRLLIAEFNKIEVVRAIAAHSPEAKRRR